MLNNPNVFFYQTLIKFAIRMAQVSAFASPLITGVFTDDCELCRRVTIHLHQHNVKVLCGINEKLYSYNNKYSNHNKV